MLTVSGVFSIAGVYLQSSKENCKNARVRLAWTVQKVIGLFCDPYNKFSYAVLLSHDLPKVTRLLCNHARSTDVDRISHAVEVFRNKFITYPVYSYFKRFVIFVCLLFFLFCFRFYVHRAPQSFTLNDYLEDRTLPKKLNL